MSFLNPLFLLGLAALAVPVIFHLINLRKPEQLPFSTLAFFQVLQKSTIRRIKIKQYLLLLLRMAAIALLVLALSRPFLQPKWSGAADRDQPTLVGLVIDNSPSMAQIDRQGPFLEQARDAAITIINQAKDQDRFLVQTTNGAAGDLMPVTPEAALRAVKNIELRQTGNFTKPRIRQLERRMKELDFRQGVVYWVSDGQTTQIDTTNWDATESTSEQALPVRFVRVGRQVQPNVAVTDWSVESRMISPSKPMSLEVTVKNFGDEPVSNQYVSVELGDKMAGQYKLEMEPGAERKYVFEVIPESTGSITGKIVLDGDETAFDNERYFSVFVPRERRILYLAAPESESRTGASSSFPSYLWPALQAAESSTTQLEVDRKSIEAVEAANLGGYDAVIMDELNSIPEYLFAPLQQLVQQGHGLVFIPAANGQLSNYNDFLGQFNAGRFSGLKGSYGSFNSIGRLGELVRGHPVLEDMFDVGERDPLKVQRPELFAYYQYIASDASTTFTVLKSNLDDPLLVDQRFGSGRLLISTLGTDPGWSNFPVQPLFAPLFYRVSWYAASTQQGQLLQQTLGEPFRWTGRMPSSSITLVKDSVRVKPEVQSVTDGYRIQYAGNEWEPGWVYVSSDSVRKAIGLNLPTGESNFSRLEPNVLEKFLANRVTTNRASVIDAGEMNEQQLSRELEAAGFGSEIWYWFLGMALLLLITETVVSKGYKAETVS